MKNVTVKVRETWTECVHCKRTYKDNREHCFYCEKATAERGKWVTRVVPECVAKLAAITGRVIRIVK